MCKYCDGSTPLFDNRTKLSRKGDFYPGIQVCVDIGQMCIESCADVYEPNFQDETFEINYCPMCGRKL